MHAAAGSVEKAAGNGETYGAGNYEMIRVTGSYREVGFRPTVRSSCYGKRNPWQCVQ